MKKRQLSAVLCIIAVLIIQNISAFAQPQVSAQAAIVTELISGRILYSKNIDERLPMASTTKIMTAFAAIENAGDRADDVIEISESAAGVEGSSMYLQVGEKMTLRELLYGLMLSSGNDAAVAIAETVGGAVDKFVEIMNHKAAEIGAENTHFTNPNGLPDENHYSTARDMAAITGKALQNQTFAEIVKTKSMSISGEGKAYPRTLTNHNKLLKMYDGCIGVKTGFTKAAGRCLVSAAERDGMTLICVTLNAPNDWSDHASLLDYGFDNFKIKQLADMKKPIATAEIIGSSENIIPVYPEKDIFFPLAEGEELYPEIELYPELYAPLKKDECVGSITFVTDNGRETTSDLVAGAEVPLIVREKISVDSDKMNFGEKLVKSIRKFFVEWIKFA